VASLHPLTLPDEPLRRIHARVADTQAILGQLVASVRRRPKPIALLTSLRSGGLRLHVARPVLREVERKILEDIDVRDYFERKQVTRDQVLACWTRELLPLVRVVNLGTPDPLESAQVAQTDATDVPTAHLAAVLGPGSTWSADHDLVDPGLAQPYDHDVLRVVIAIRNVCEIDVKIYTSSQAASLVANLGIELISAITRMNTRGKLIVGVGAAVVVAGCVYAARRYPERYHAALDALREIGATISREIEAGYALQRDWAEHVPLPLDLETPLPERLIARALAGASSPLASDEIRQALATRGKQLALGDIARELDADPMFVRVDRRLWQLGQHERELLVVANTRERSRLF
jgi:hypothetical protein